ncbi:hypothetical protein Vi05172_g12865 [Venturia inaequalis]|nr:hypothetical protein Vi05172_g12865 [Venturia inaequalis]
MTDQFKSPRNVDSDDRPKAVFDRPKPVFGQPNTVYSSLFKTHSPGNKPRESAIFDSSSNPIVNWASSAKAQSLDAHTTNRTNRQEHAEKPIPDESPFASLASTVRAPWATQNTEHGQKSVEGTTAIEEKDQKSRVVEGKWYPAQSSLRKPLCDHNTKPPGTQNLTGKKAGLPKGEIEKHFPRLRRTEPFHPDRQPIQQTKPISRIPVFSRTTHANLTLANAAQFGEDVKNARIANKRSETMDSALGVPVFGQPTQLVSAFAKTAHSGNDLKNTRIVSEKWKTMDNPLAKLANDASVHSTRDHPPNNALTTRFQEHVPLSKLPVRQSTAPKKSCANCSKNKDIAKLQRCTRCLSYFYCNRECQEAHLQIHKEECMMPIQSPRPRVPDSVARLQVEKLEEMALSSQISSDGAGRFVFQSAWKVKPKGPRPSPPPRIQSQRTEERTSVPEPNFGE